MKPVDAIKILGFEIRGYREIPYSQAWVRYTLMRYKDKDTVVAYEKGLITSTLILRGLKKFFVFVFIADGIHFGGYDYQGTRVDHKKNVVMEVMRSIENNGVIVDSSLFKSFKDRIILEAI